MHDIRFILPITLKGKYFQRMQDMKRYGFLNIGPYNVKITLLVEQHNPASIDWKEVQQGWPAEVEILDVPYTNVQHKFACFYLNDFNNAQSAATWTARIDDDSSTDVGALMGYLSEFNPNDPHHLIAQQCGDIHNLQPAYYPLLEKYGITRRMTDKWNHSWEISIDSQEAINRFSRNLQVRALYRDVIKMSPDEFWWADQIYCYAMRMAGVWPTVTNFLSKDANIRNFTFTGGKFAHIHYVANDLDERSEFVHKRGVWSEFKSSVDKVLHNGL